MPWASWWTNCCGLETDRADFGGLDEIDEEGDVVGRIFAPKFIGYPMMGGVDRAAEE